MASLVLTDSSQLTSDSQHLAALVFYVNSFASLILFLLLARDWPALSRHWHSVETTLGRYRYPGGLARKTNRITFIILCLFLLEYTLYHVKTGLIAARCSKGGGGLDVLRFFFVNSFPHVFNHVSYSLPVGLWTLYVNLTCSFTRNYADLFIILVSVHLAEKFRRINRRLATVEGKDLPEMFWLEAREEYNQLSYLTKIVDDKLSKIVLLSFGNNLYFICLETLHSFE
uniref:Uncharacterized protein n=1 Tax=Timema shepardi TaxID=629360 RepID=A0A7R9G5U5_TIMSH|nr:unnamed protein product [Timema shepardi]